jgi:drug/metabolite transporter (DMT)-like permease
MINKQKALILILLASVLSGATSSITKVGLKDFPPLSFAFIRFLISGIIVSPFLLKTDFFKDFKRLILFSLLGTINIVFFILGIKITTATIGQLLYAGVPILTAMFLFILFKERLTLRKDAGIAIGFVGVILVILLPVIEKGAKFSGNLVGNTLIAIGVISYSLYVVYSKKKLETFSPFVITSAFIWTTCLALFPLSLTDLVTYPDWWHSVTFIGILSLGYISIFSTVVFNVLTQYAIKHGGSILASMQFYLLPIFAYFSASIILGEQLTLGLFIGGSLALLGVYIATKK